MNNALPAQVAVVIVGGGQAGLAMSYLLKERGVSHLVFERRRIAHTWRAERWESFCLVTPNWQCRLPGFSYAGDDPDGFMVRDQIVAYIEAYAASFDPPVREGVEVTHAAPRETGDGFNVETSIGGLRCDHVVVATGGYQTAPLPRLAERFPPETVQIHSSHYSAPDRLPAGDVLIVGTGQSGAQIAEDLHLAGRRVHLSVGSAPRTARRYRGRDVVAWLDDVGYYRLPVDNHPLKEGVRDNTNHYVTGRDGGHDIDLRAFARDGMQLYGRLSDVRGSRLAFAADLEENLDRADAVADGIKSTIDRYIEEHAIAAPPESRYVPVWRPERPSSELDLHTAGITAVVWCVGYGTDYRWLAAPAFDGRGYPAHRRGVTAVDGLYFLGLPWQHTWGSGRFSGVADDAEHLVEHIVRQEQNAALA